MPDPAAPIVDDFNRASLGGNWSTFGAAGNPLAISGSSILVCGGGSSYTGSYYNADSDSRPCETGIFMDGVGGTNLYFGLWLLDDPSGSSGNGYKIGTDTGTNPEEFVLYRTDAGVDTPLDAWASGGPGSTIPDNLIWWLQITETDVFMYSETGGVITLRASASDTDHLGPFFPVVDIFDAGGDQVFLDDLRFGHVGPIPPDYPLANYDYSNFPKPKLAGKVYN